MQKEGNPNHSTALDFLKVPSGSTPSYRFCWSWLIPSRGQPSTHGAGTDSKLLGNLAVACALLFHLACLSNFGLFVGNFWAASTLLVIFQGSSEPWRMRHLEIAGLIKRRATLDDEGLARLEIAWFDVRDIDAVGRRINLLQAPGGDQHRPNITRTA